jgi:RNA polymerase sigma factor (sigma-70 family)
VTHPLHDSFSFEKMIERFGSKDPLPAWAEFLSCYSPIILQVVRLFERDADHISDCFVFVCEHLSAKDFRRLRRFRPEGQALFATWLRAVVRNLCVDWQRKEFGRERVFHSISKLPQLDQDVFSFMFLRSRSSEESFAALANKHPGLTTTQLEESAQRVRNSLSARQFWLLESRAPKFESLDNEEFPGSGQVSRSIPDRAPGPEQLFSSERLGKALNRALEQLPVRDRLMIKLRFSQGLGLREVAAALGLKDAQTADRQLRKILERLRKQLSEFA